MQAKIKSRQKLWEALSEVNEEKDDIFSEEEERVKKLTEQFLKKDTSSERLELLKEYNAGVALTGAVGIRRKLAAIDLEYFGKVYFPHFFSKLSPQFHEDLDDIWTQGVLKGLNPDKKSIAKSVNKHEGCKRGVAAPRGHAKSTNLTFKDTIHAIVYQYKHYIILISDTYDQAKGFLEAIKEELEENTAIQNDFGNLTGKIWREDVIVTKTKIKVQAKGAAQKMRGLKHKNWRPDLIILDDCENDELVRTPEQREKLKNWYYKAVSKCGDSYTDFIFIGTMLHYDSLLAKIMKNAKYKTVKYKAVIEFSKSPLWDEWEEIFNDLSNENHEGDARDFFEQHKEEMLSGTKVLWEDKLSYYQLMEMRVSEGEAAFNSEEQNEPINPEDCLFNDEWFDYYNPHEIDFSNGFEFFGFVDPSLGKSKKSDYSAIITIAKETATGYMYVEDADIERRHPDKIITDVIEKAFRIGKQYKARYKVFGAETNQFQWFLKEQLAKASAKVGVYLPIQEVNQTADKVLRVQTLQPDIKNKYLKFNRQHKKLLEQLRYFPMADHDDGPDALESCRTLAAGAKRRLRFLDIRKFGL